MRHSTILLFFPSFDPRRFNDQSARKGKRGTQSFRLLNRHQVGEKRVMRERERERDKVLLPSYGVMKRICKTTFGLSSNVHPSSPCFSLYPTVSFASPFHPPTLKTNSPRSPLAFSKEREGGREFSSSRAKKTKNCTGFLPALFASPPAGTPG